MLPLDLDPVERAMAYPAEIISLYLDNEVPLQNVRNLSA